MLPSEPGVATSWQEAIQAAPVDPSVQTEAFRVNAALSRLEALKPLPPTPPAENEVPT